MKKILLSSLMLAGLLTNQKVSAQASCPSLDFSDPNPVRIVDRGEVGDDDVDEGDVYVFHNVLPSSSKLVFAVVEIEKVFNAKVFQLDNNSTNAQRFQPVIATDRTDASTDLEGYVQFAVSFRDSIWNVVDLSQLRLTGFDLDGTTQPSYKIMETGWISEAAVSLNAPSNLTDAGMFSDAGFNWKKILGEPLDQPGISNDPAIAFNATYGGSFDVSRFRLGYVYDQQLNAMRDYSIQFNCLEEAQVNIPLPLTLLNFNGSYASNKSILNWRTQSEVNVDRFEIERSADGNNFIKIGSVGAKGSNGTNDYQLTEDVTNVAGGIFYYRLKSIDKDGKFTYSKVVALRRDTKLFNQISITPNPIINGNGVIKITATSNSTADIKIVDFAGRIIMLQKVNLFEGVNVLPINVARQLSAGVYSIQLFKGGEVLNSKFVVGR